MKHKSHCLLSVILMVIAATLSCSNSKTKDNPQPVPQDSIGPMSKEDVINFFQYYHEVDSDYYEIQVARLENLYAYLEEQGEVAEPTVYSLEWYKANVAHIDSLMYQAEALLTESNYDSLFNILKSERINIWAHPNTFTEMVYGWSMIFADLAKSRMSDEDYAQFMIENFEMLMYRIEAQEGDQAANHPFYEGTLTILQKAYAKLGDAENLDIITSKLAKIQQE